MKVKLKAIDEKMKGQKAKLRASENLSALKHKNFEMIEFVSFIGNQLEGKDKKERTKVKHFLTYCIE